MLICASIIIMLLGKVLEGKNQKMNYFVGYRTTKSLENERNWIAAQELSSELMHSVFLKITFMYIPFLIIDSLYLFGYLEDKIFTGSLIIQTVILVSGFIYIFIVTEKMLASLDKK